MNSIADTLPQASRPARQIPFTASEAAPERLGRGAIALRVFVAAAAILLVAAQLSTREFDAGWHVAGIVFCVLVAAVLALSLRSMVSLGGGIGQAWHDMLQRRASARADQRFLARAQHDPRLMAEIQVAISRAQGAGEFPGAAHELIDDAARRQQRSQLAH